jgi:hypothetical protein
MRDIAVAKSRMPGCCCFAATWPIAIIRNRSHAMQASDCSRPYRRLNGTLPAVSVRCGPDLQYKLQIKYTLTFIVTPAAIQGGVFAFFESLDQSTVGRCTAT